jgi:S1-C subfamily serine protease
VLHFFTDLHEDYHRTTDDGQKINVAGFDQVAAFVTGVVTALGNRPVPLTTVTAMPQAPSAEASSAVGYGAYLGTVPDMTGSPGGVRLIGVRAGSPAEKAGLRGDDIITRIGEMDVPDLQAMTDALRSHQPGDTVDIVVRRGNVETTLRATLGSRGG